MKFRRKYFLILYNDHFQINRTIYKVEKNILDNFHSRKLLFKYFVYYCVNFKFYNPSEKTECDRSDGQTRELSYFSSFPFVIRKIT